MDLKHLLSLYIAELEARGESSREEILSQNADISAEINRFFQFMDKAQGSSLGEPTLDSSERVTQDLDRTALHSPSKEAALTWDSQPASDEGQPTDEHVPSPNRQPSRSTLIGNYKLLQKIAEGGMGAVWLAEQQKPVRRRVALKLIKAGRDSDHIIARFDAERQALAMMEHQNIAKMLDAGQTEDGLPYFVMELVQGVPITQYCDDNKLSLEERLQLFIPVCQAIQHAHQKGIIHRDLKPSNILVTLYDAQAVPKVIDFGLAKATQHQTRLTDKTMFTEFGQVVGTLQYMSPEQAELNSLDVDTRTDVYALGILLYELLTGTTPLERSSLQNVSILKVLETIRNQEPLRPSARLSGSGEAIAGISAQRRVAPEKLHGILKGDLDWVVMKALEKDRVRRYQSASALADDVQRYLNNEPLQARPPSNLYLAQKFFLKHRMATIAVSCMLGLLILGLTGTTIGMSRALVAQAREATARKTAEDNLTRAVDAEAAERQRSNELKLRSEELEKLTQFQQNQIRDIDAAKMGIQLRQKLLKDYGSVSGDASASQPPQSQLDLEQAIQRLNFTDLALDALRTTIFLPAFETINKQYADQPAFQAKMLLTLSTTMRAAGIFDSAVIEQCISIRERLEGPQAAETLEAKLELGHLLSDQGKLISSTELYAEILKTCRSALGSQHPTTHMAIGAYANALHSLGRYEEAENLLRENLKLRQQVYPSDSEQVLNSMADLASTLKHRGQTTEAESLMRQVLATHIKQLGEKHTNVYMNKLNLGSLLYEVEQYEEATRLDQEAFAGFREALGEMHPYTCAALNNLAANYILQDQPALALDLYRDLLVKSRASVGDEHPQTMLAANNTALCLKKLKQFEESASLYIANIPRQRRVLGAQHPQTLRSLYDLGALYFSQEKFAQAAPWLEEYTNSTWDPDACCIFVRSLLLKGDKAEATRVAGNLQSRAREKLKDEPHELGVFLGGVARELYLYGDNAAAQPLLEEAQKLFLQTNDRDSDDAVDVDTMLSDVKTTK